MLTVDGTLDLALDDVPLHCEARGSEVRLDCGELPALLRAARGLGGGGGGGPLALVRRVASALARVGLTVRVYSRGRVVLVLGARARPGLAERFLGVPHLQLGSGGELLRLFRA